MPRKTYLLRQTVSLFKLAKQIRDPEVASVLLAKAADFNEPLSEPSLPRKDVSARAPDVEP